MAPKESNAANRIFPSPESYNLSSEQQAAFFPLNLSPLLFLLVPSFTFSSSLLLTCPFLQTKRACPHFKKRKNLKTKLNAFDTIQSEKKGRGYK
jgi:hypothetical protein